MATLKDNFLRAIFLNVSDIWWFYCPYDWRNKLDYTRFEKARIIGARALQISMGAPPTLTKIPKDVIDPVEISMLEFEEDAIPITVKRDQ